MLLPSSPAVGKAMAKAICGHPKGRVVELGAGTGAVTRQLLEQGVPAKDLTCLELDESFAAYLRHAFPDIDVVCAPAQHLSAIWTARGLAPAGAVVSTLPIRLFSPDATRQALDAVREVVAADAPFLQLTFRVSGPIPPRLLASAQFAGARHCTIWSNLPPAFVWRYRRI